MTETDEILCERKGEQDGIIWLTLNRPERLNALTFPLLRKMREIPRRCALRPHRALRRHHRRRAWLLRRHGHGRRQWQW